MTHTHAEHHLDRRQKILEHVDLGGDGLEIGALHHPILRRSDARVRYVDHADTDALHTKYTEHDEVEEIVDVDIVWNTERLSDTLVTAGGAQQVDFVVASHVIEHVPDVIGWLGQLAEVLRPGGVLSLAIPDKRYCFDARRGTTSTGEIVGAWLEHRSRPSPAAVYDFYALLADVDTAATWAGTATHDTLPIDYERGLDLARRAVGGEYLDVHCWTFTPASFLDLLRDLAVIGAMPYELVGFRPTAPGGLEFHVSLARLSLDLDEASAKERALRSLEGRDVADSGGADVQVVALSPAEVRLVHTKRRVLEGIRRFFGASPALN